MFLFFSRLRVGALRGAAYSGRRLRLGIALLCLGLSLAASQGAARAEPGVTSGKILFGQVAALTGPAGALGRDLRTGLLAAFGEVNRAGGVGGRQLELISRDDGYEPNRSIEATKAMIDDDKVFALVGAVGTPTTLATEPIMAAAKVPLIGPFSGAEFLRAPDKTNVVNVRASYFQETEAMVEHLTKDKGISRIAILYQDDAFGRAGLAGVQRALDSRGLKLVAEGTFERNTTAVKMALLAIRKGSPEAVILIGPYRPCAAFIKLARPMLSATYVNISFVGSNSLAKELGPDGDGIIVTQVVPFPWDTSIPIVARYQAALHSLDATEQPGFVTFEGYVIGRLVIAGLQKISGEPTRQALLDAIFSGEFDLGGLKLTYRPGHNQGSNAVFLTEIQADGSFRPLTSLREGTN